MIKKTQGILKGAPSGLIISLLVHASAFLLAGMLVVFTVHQKDGKKFVPPKPVDRPKMKLKKPTVKVKKTARPKSTTRIVTKVKRASMPDIQLPEMTGMTDGLVGGISGFEIIPDLDAVSVFGSGQSIGNDFEGTFYDFKRNRRGSLAAPMDSDKYNEVVGKFIESGWKESKFSQFYRSPKKLYTTSFMVSGVPSEFGPWALVNRRLPAITICCITREKLSIPKGDDSGFGAMGDNVLVIRVGGKVVFDFGNQFTYAWDGKESRRSSYHMAHWPAYYGQWFDLEPGVPLDMELIFGETAGGLSAVMLAVEEEGTDYPKNFENGPMLPIFKTAQLSKDEVDSIYEYLYEDHYCVTNGPVFNDYAGSKRDAIYKTENLPSVAEENVARSFMRIWTLKSGRNVEAELVVQMGDKLVLKTARGKTVKVPVAQFSEDDLDYVELENPPPLKITFLQDADIFKLGQIPNSGSSTKVTRFTSGLKIEKTNMAPYTRELKVEFFSFASEIDGRNYILLDRQERRFSFSEEDRDTYEFMGEEVLLRDYLDGNSDRRGERYCGRMILVTDERGEIIAQETSNPWMFENLDFVRTFPVGRHFSKKGMRVHPPRPEVTTFWWDAWL